MPGVEAVAGRFERQEVDVGRQRLVRRAQDLLAAELAGGLQMGDLGQGVDPGVGPPRPTELDFLPGCRFDRLPHFAGNRARILLFLPPAVAGAFVFDGQTVGGHLNARIAVL